MLENPVVVLWEIISVKVAVEHILHEVGVVLGAVTTLQPDLFQKWLEGVECA